MAATAFNGDYITFGAIGTAGFTLYCRFHVSSYASWGDTVALDESQSDAALEYDGSGNLYWTSGGGNFSTGSSSSWFDLAITVTSGGSATVYWKLATDTSWTTLTTYTASTSAVVTIGAWPAWYPSSSGLGTNEIVGLKLWNEVRTTSELLDEATQATPVHTSGIRFWNSLFSASTAHVNQTGGSDGAVTGTPADSALDSGLPLLAGGGGGGSSDVPGSSQRDRDLRHNGIYRMRGRDVIAPQHRGLFAPERQIHVVPALPARMRVRAHRGERPCR